MKTITTLIILTINRRRFTQIFYDFKMDKNYKHSDLTKKIIVAIILLFFFQSCVISEFKPESKTYDYKKILSETGKSYVYRTRIHLYDNDFSGLIVIKSEKTGHRIVFLNEIGMKFFDIELLPRSYKIHHIFKPMNKKMLIKLLVSDFNFILMNNIKSENKFLKEKKSEKFALKPKKVKNIYYLDKNTLLPKEAFKYSAFRKTTLLNYKNYNTEIPQNISIKHKNIKFAMELSFIK